MSAAYSFASAFFAELLRSSLRAAALAGEPTGLAAERGGAGCGRLAEAGVLPRLALGDLGLAPAPPEAAVAFFAFFAAAFFSSKLTRLIVGSSSSSLGTNLRFSTLPGYASRVFDIGPPSVRAPPAGPTRARKSPNWSVRVRSVGPENQQKLSSVREGTPADLAPRVFVPITP